MSFFIETSELNRPCIVFKSSLATMEIPYRHSVDIYVGANEWLVVVDMGYTYMSFISWSSQGGMVCSAKKNFYKQVEVNPSMVVKLVHEDGLHDSIFSLICSLEEAFGKMRKDSEIDYVPIKELNKTPLSPWTWFSHIYNQASRTNTNNQRNCLSERPKLVLRSNQSSSEL